MKEGQQKCVNVVKNMHIIHNNPRTKKKLFHDERKMEMGITGRKIVDTGRILQSKPWRRGEN